MEMDVSRRRRVVEESAPAVGTPARGGSRTGGTKMNSNTEAERSIGGRPTPDVQHPTSTDTDRSVFTDRDGRELSLIRVRDDATLPVLGYTPRAVSWAAEPDSETTADTAAEGHVSIDVSAGVPDARYYPGEASHVGAPNSVSLAARVLDPETAGYPDAPFVVRLVTEEFVSARHDQLLPPAFDLVYWSLADRLATDGGTVPENEQATDEEVRAAVEAAETEDAWKPEPISLRDGETPDHDSHAARNLAQLEQGLEDDILDAEDLSAEQRAQLGVDECDDEAPSDAEPVLLTDGAGLVGSGEATVDHDGGDVSARKDAVSTGDEVYDHDREQYGEVVEIVEDAVVSGGRRVDRVRIRWDSGADEWHHREWLHDDVGRAIERVTAGSDADADADADEVVSHGNE